MFLLKCDVHSCNTRSTNSFRLPYCRTNARKFSLRFQGPKIFNSLSPEIQNASSTALFNSKLKSFFLWYKHTIGLLMLVCKFSLLSLFFLIYSCIIFSHLFFLVFALTRSAFSIFILFNDYFLCSKHFLKNLICIFLCVFFFWQNDNKTIKNNKTKIIVWKL